MGNPMDFYFKVLEIPKDSSPQEIRAAYRALIKKWHPDKHPAPSKPRRRRAACVRCRTQY